MNNERVYKMKISGVYPLYIQKVERKGRTKAEVDTVIQWLTGYDEYGLQSQIDRDVNFETFFAEAPQINPNASKITGVICGVRVEEIEDSLIQKIRWLDKLVDELAKGKPMERVLRSLISRNSRELKMGKTVRFLTLFLGRFIDDIWYFGVYA